jgi:putative membrane protein
MYKSALVLTLTTMLGVFFAVSIVRAADESKLSSKDAKFLRNAAAGGVMEVELGKVAADRGASDDVKQFGQKMVDDHTKINDELKTLAQNKGLDLEKALDEAAKKSKREADDMGNRKGAQFDRAYLNMMVKDHEKDVKEFEEASKDAEDSDVKAFAAKTLTTLQEHLDTAKATRGKLAK